MEYDKDSTKIVQKEINNALIPIIELMNKFNGNIEISSNSDNHQPPKQWRKRIPSNAHLSGARSASMLKYFIKSGLKVNEIKVKNLLWGSYKPYKFIDQQIKGPYTLWHHTHTFEEKDGGTLIKDKLRYAIPFGLLGRLIHFIYIKYDINGIFQYRHKILNQIFKEIKNQSRD